MSHWFGALRAESLDHAKRYCLDKESLTLPALSLRIIDRRAAGRRPVFDIAVPEVQAFLAGNIAVHNCIGNSGPLKPEISEAVKAGDVVACSVLSGNRNFEGRVHPEIKMNFLASPPLVVAYALAGNLDVDITTEPLGTGKDGKPVYLKDVWPSAAEVAHTVGASVDSAMFTKGYADVFRGDERWRGIKTPAGKIYAWDAKSTYVKNPPYFEGMSMTPAAVGDIKGARALAVLGDSVTTDHISPAGNISKSSPAAKYLMAQGVSAADFNSYGARRGNHEVMMRGTFANIRLRNLLVPGTEGGVTVHIPSGEQTSIFDAAMKYKTDGTPLVILAGKEYGTGSSRDWAAKGTMLLGVRAVIAESFERIHRSNLIGMGVLPLQFKEGENARDSRAHRQGDVRHRRARRRRRQNGHRGRTRRRRQNSRVPGTAAHRHPEGARLLPPRRHLALRAAAARRQQEGSLTRSAAAAPHRGGGGSSLPLTGAPMLPASTSTMLAGSR